MKSGSRRAPASCRTKSCIGVIRITKDMRNGLVYRSKTFGVLTWTQGALGLVTIAIYVFLHGESQLSPTYLQTSESTNPPNFGLGITASGIQILGVTVTILAIHEVNYCWLHLAMSMHILTVLAQSLLSMRTIFLVFPNDSTNTTSKMEGIIDIQQEVTKERTMMAGSHWEEYLTIVASTCTLVSMFIGSFLGSATGYAVCCGVETREKRKSSLEGTKELQERNSRRERKLVKFGFEPSNVAANLGSGIDEESRYTPSLHNLGTPQDSVIFINRHAQMLRNEPIKDQVFT